MPGIAADLALPDRAQARAGFDRAARSFASACFIHDEARRRLLERLEAFTLAPGRVVDVGSALGSGIGALVSRYPDASLIALDSSLSMLGRANAGTGFRVAGDATQLPFPDRSIDLLFANLVLPWTRPEQLFAEARRVLTPDGLLVFSTLGPDTLQELRQAWYQSDDAIHVHAFWDMQTLGDLALGAGLEEPVLDVDRIRVSYAELSGLIRDLRACGATNTALGRRRGLTGRGRWQRFVEALWHSRGQGSEARLSLTVELIFGQAFGSRARSRQSRNGDVIVPLEDIGRLQHGK